MSNLKFYSVLMGLLLYMVTAPLSVEASESTKKMEEIYSQYLKACGGTYYSKCDDRSGMNQRALFSHADRLAMKEKKLVFVNVGADWCPSCVAYHKQLEKNPALKNRIDLAYVTVDLNYDIAEVKALLKEFGINVPGVPAYVIFDPSTRKVIDKGFSFSMSLSDLTARLESISQTKRLVVVPVAEAKVVGKIRLDLLEKPIGLQSGIGESDFVFTTKLIGADQKKIINYVRQGVSYLHNFYWINAVRSFEMALQLEPENPVVRSLLALSLNEIETMTGNVDRSYRQISAARSNKTMTLTAEEKRWINFVYEQTCLMRFEACKDLHGDPSQGGAALSYLQGQPKSKDLKAIVAYKVYAPDVLKDVMRENSQHAGANHYLIHFFEALGQISNANLVAANYAKEAPNSPHAQHMYGHILPQIGQWEKAEQQFRRANELHELEFKKEGILFEEDWHYSHNLDLWSATLLYLNRIDEAERVAELGCERTKSCLNAAMLNIANGKYLRAKEKLDVVAKVYGNHPLIKEIQVLIALGLKDVSGAKLYLSDKEAHTLMQKLSQTGDEHDSGTNLFSLIALQAITKPGVDVKPLVNRLDKALEQPGFDEWSTGVLGTRALARVLEDNGKSQLASTIRFLSISLQTKNGCKN